MSNERNHGGPRRNAGRPRLGEELRVSVTFSVDQEIAKMLRELRDAGDNINGLVSHIIAVRYEQIITGHLHIEK